MTIKLERIPDRMPVKLTVSISPELNAALADYAHAYEESYGQAAAIADLVPAIVATFLEGDRAFQRARRKRCDSLG